MRNHLWSLHLILLIVGKLGAFASDEAMVDVGYWPDTIGKEIMMFTAPAKDVDKVREWQPGSPDILPMKTLVELAIKRAVPPGTIKYLAPQLLIIQWQTTSSEQHDKNIWMMVVRFQFELARDTPETASIRDGEAYVNVYLLPNGAPITMKTRPMTHKEKVENGLERLTEEEIEENRRKLDKDDPFYPPPKSKS